MKSTLFSLNLKDALRGLIMAGLVPVLVVIQQSITAGTVVFDWPSIWKAALAGFVGYLLKNFFTDTTKSAQNTLIDAKVSEVKKTEPDPKIAAMKIDDIKQNPPQ